MQFKKPMKKLIIILLIIAFQPSFSQNENKSEFEIIGKWKSEDDTGFGYFTFKKDGSTIIETQDRILGGENFEQNGMKFSLEYKIVSEKKPIELDLTFTELKSGRKLVWPCIIKFNNRNEILLARGTNGKRPDNFITSDYAIFKRIE